MRIEKIQIENFRLLKNVEILLDRSSTVIVGRNNSGKTSLTELFRRLLSGSISFCLEDFSLAVHERFWNAFVLQRQGEDIDKVRAALPVIRIVLYLTYETSSNLGLLREFIIDLDATCTRAKIEIVFEPEGGKTEKLFEGIDVASIPSEEEKKIYFFKTLKERIIKVYAGRLFAVDPNDPLNTKEVDWSKLRGLLLGGFINAQRGLDDVTSRESDVLGKILSALFTNAMSDAADADDKSTAQQIEIAVEQIQSDIDTKFNEQLKNLLPTFALFGYPGFPDPKLRTETAFDVERLLNNHTKIRYPGANGVHLPETYNGLGARNLIYILLKLHEFFKSFTTSQPLAGIHLIFIEEPEAHLHPQMQEVFISKLGEIAAAFVSKYGQPWPVQFVVTTHSSHMANRASFPAMRYFLSSKADSGEFCETNVKDLSQGLGGVPEADQKFLHQYMTLTRCDLLFADKAILIEGTSERLMLPPMIQKLESIDTRLQSLSSQYVSILEVGGAYAHRFFALLEFLELKTLIITDIDSAKMVASKLNATLVSDATHTTNGCIKTWFAPDVSPAALLAKTDDEKTNGSKRIAYQVPEKDAYPCGRSFEEAFVLANPTLFGLAEGLSPQELETRASELAHDEKKSEFALKYAIEESEWNVPRYISEGLAWLADESDQVSSQQSEASEEQALAPVGA